MYVLTQEELDRLRGSKETTEQEIVDRAARCYTEHRDALMQRLADVISKYSSYSSAYSDPYFKQLVSDLKAAIHHKELTVVKS